MVVNVDMPHTEIGWGSVHMEDTVRIRPDGSELLTSNDTKLRAIPERTIANETVQKGAV